MACFHPIAGYRSRKVGSSGKRSIVFSVREGYVDLPVNIPCGQCVGCRLERSRQWAIRCMHEASLYDRNCFVTLTYDDVYLPVGASLDKRAFPLFMKRLRKRFSGERIRYFHCGEYGSVGRRPHYHACLFGFDFADKYAWAIRKGFTAYRSASLESLWPFGQSELGSVTFESAAYVARYVMKKVTGDRAECHYESVEASTGEVVQRVPEFTTMSRRPGIGKKWLDKFVCEVYPADSVLVRGRLMKPPRYYDVQYEIGAPVDMARVRFRREQKVKPEDNTLERLRVREQVACLNLERKVRELE